MDGRVEEVEWKRGEIWKGKGRDIRRKEEKVVGRREERKVKIEIN